MTVGLIPRADVYKKAKDYVTFYYETSRTAPECYGITAGNFDGAGLSHGIIQFNFKSGTIQPIWTHLINNYPTVCLTAFNNDQARYDEWKNVVLNYTIANQIAWADALSIATQSSATNKRKLVEPWATYFYQLGITPESIARQDIGVQPYLDNGENWKKKYSLWSRRGFLLMFDIAVQSGGLGATVEANIQSDIANLSPTLTKNERETEIMRIVANRKADTIDPTWQQSYRDRKLAIANGSGLVYGSPTDTTPYDMILEPAFDYDVEHPPFPAIRYVRDWLNGSNANLNNYWNEIRVTTTNGTIISQGKTITSNGTITNVANITDNTVTTYGYETSNTGAKYAQLDLGAIHTDISTIEVFHYYNDSRIFNGTKVEVSSDGIEWVTLRDSAISGTYAESSAGLTLKSNSYPQTVEPVDPSALFPPMRFVRDWLNGNTANPNNYWNEIKIIAGGTNIAQGLTPSSNGTLTNPMNITDGNNTTYGYILSTVGDTPDYIQIDLGTVRSDIESIGITHFYADGRTFYGTKTEISEDGITWIPLYDSLFDGMYQETSQGRTYYPTDIPSDEEIPTIAITGLSLERLSDETGFQSTSITFRSNVAIDRYTVRCGGTSYNTGIDCETGSKDVGTVVANHTVESALDFSVGELMSFPANTDITAIVSYNELDIEGNNKINIYGRNLRGVWNNYQT